MTSYTEIFDRNALTLILANKNYVEGLIKTDIDEDDQKYSPFEICRKYLNNATGKNNNNVEVNYIRKDGQGRRFAQHGLSLQSMPRLIRGTLAKDYYYDIDMVNAHPNILLKICNDNDLITTWLNTYLNYRDKLITDIAKDAGGVFEKDYIKKSILSIMYGGVTNYNKILKVLEDRLNVEPTPKIEMRICFLKSFADEMTHILDNAPIWFPEEYERQIKLKGADYFNLKGSTLSASICKIEDYILEVMINELKIKKIIDKIAVLTFDGIMILKKRFKNVETLNTLILHLENKILEETGYSIKLKVKNFDYIDLTNLEPSIKEQQNLKSLYLNTKYYWFDFMKDMSIVFNSKTELFEKFGDNVAKVMFRVYECEGCYFRKISNTKMFVLCKSTPEDVFMFKDKRPDGSIFVNTISFSNVLKKGCLPKIPCYNSLDFKPSGVFENRDTEKDNRTEDEIKDEDRNFNTWTNFMAKLIPFENINMDLVNPHLNHIKKVWASDDEETYQYMLSWFYTIFTKPKNKSKVAMVLRSKEKQIGKGIFITNFLIPYVFGNNYAMSIAGLNTITDRFNEIVMNKLMINCDELTTIDGGYHSTFDILLKRITDNTIKIEIKNGKSFIYPDFSNYIMCTNNDFTIKIEIGDARYFITECSPIYKGDRAYFDNLYNCFTQEHADHFFSYICYMDKFGIKPVDIRDIPMTNIKKDMTITGLQPPVKFLLHLREKITELKTIDDNDDNDEKNIGLWYGLDLNENLCKADNLYNAYKQWCLFGNEKVSSITKFGRDVRDYIQKKRLSRGYVYDLETCNIPL